MEYLPSKWLGLTLCTTLFISQNCTRKRAGRETLLLHSDWLMFCELSFWREDCGSRCESLFREVYVDISDALGWVFSGIRPRKFHLMEADQRASM